MSIHYCKHDLLLLGGALVFIQVRVQCWCTTFHYIGHLRVLVFLPCTYRNVFRSTLFFVFICWISLSSISSIVMGLCCNCVGATILLSLSSFGLSYSHLP